MADEWLLLLVKRLAQQGRRTDCGKVKTVGPHSFRKAQLINKWMTVNDGSQKDFHVRWTQTHHLHIPGGGRDGQRIRVVGPKVQVFSETCKNESRLERIRVALQISIRSKKALTMQKSKTHYRIIMGKYFTCRCCRPATYARIVNKKRVPSVLGAIPH